MPKIKTIDVQAKEWHDKANGNSYFAGKVILNYGMPSEKTFVMPFQYGYGDGYIFEAAQVLMREKYLDQYPFGNLRRYCRENGIILRDTLIHNCLKKELKEF